MDMMHAQVVGIAPEAPTGLTFVRAGSGPNQRYDLSWQDNSMNETAFVVERRVAGSTGAWTTVATVPSTVLAIPYVKANDLGPTLGLRTYADPIGNTRTLYEYQVYAINVVGDVWDYSNPAFNNILVGGFPTLTLDSRGDASSGVAAPSGLTGSPVVKNRRTATVNLSWTDASNNETGFLIQRADNAGFSLGVVNATVASNVTTFAQTVSPGRTYYYRVLAFSDAHQSAWSNTATVIVP
jgi:hypothetical protein